MCWRWSLLPLYWDSCFILWGWAMQVLSRILGDVVAGLFYGVWFWAGLLLAYAIRKPGAALLGEFGAALVAYALGSALGSPMGALMLVLGMGAGVGTGDGLCLGALPELGLDHDVGGRGRGREQQVLRSTSRSTMGSASQSTSLPAVA